MYGKALLFKLKRMCNYIIAVPILVDLDEHVSEVATVLEFVIHLTNALDHFNSHVSPIEKLSDSFPSPHPSVRSFCLLK